jgi:VIT1/CCC1 family predicted Fe2+/Mn2+ transporter
VSLGRAVASDRQLARLLQIGVVLEEMVEASANHHTREYDADLDEEVADLLQEAAEESADHRDRLEELIAELDAESVPYEEIEVLVESQYATDDEFDDVLYDQLCNEETAYKFYDDLLTAIAASDASFSVERERVVETLTQIRAEEAEGVEDVTTLMERRA